MGAALRRHPGDLAAEPRLAPDWTPSLLALALAGLALIEIWVQPIFQTGIPGPRLAVSLAALLATLPLAWCRSRPLPALVLLIAGALVVGLVGDRNQSAFELLPALLAGVYAVAAYASARAAAAGAGIVLFAGLLYSWLTYADGDGPTDVIVPLLLLAGAWAVGAQVGRHRARASSLGATAAVLAEERDRSAELAAREERARIARELHDAVAQSVSLTVMHVGAARLLLGERDVRSRELLLTAEARGREALAEMRRMLGILRSDDDEPLAPVPSLRRLDALASQLEAAGLAVELRIEGEPVRLPPGLDLTAYRIVQEGLANALRHGDGDAARVTVSYGTDEVALEIRNPLADRRPAQGAGHGLVGVEERVLLFAGTASAGPRGREWVLSATFPLEGAAA